jgi:AcrR family transcriptional regulator
MQSKDYYVEQKLAEALIELLNTSPLNEISVRELCNKAGVGRASFYRHFQSKEEILERHAQSLIQKWAEEFEAAPDSRPWNVFESLFHHLKEHQSFYEALHKAGRDSILRAAIRTRIGLTSNLSNEDAYQKIFFADGISGWVEEWIDRGLPETPEKLNQQLGQYFTKVLPTLSKLYSHI